MRKARIKPEGIPMFYHLYNRVAGEPDFHPFGQTEKEKFVRLIHRLQAFFTVEVLAYQIMSNHFHLLVYAPETPPEPTEVAARYEAYYKGKRSISPDDPLCTELAHRMRDISWFMHALQQQFATWYNQSRTTPRRGTLWAQRFKHTLLGDADAVWACWKYIEMNPVRAGLVNHPADYRFCSYGAWSGTGCHPFSCNVKRRLLPLLQGLYPYSSLEQIYCSLRRAFSNANPIEHYSSDALTACLDVLDRRCQYWVNGLVIGSAVFIRDIISRSNGALKYPPTWLPDYPPSDIQAPFMVYNLSKRAQYGPAGSAHC